MPLKAVFVSDLHLSGPGDPKTELFTRWLRNLPATHVFLVGDIFDLWVADHDYFAAKFAGVVSAIRALVARGVEVHYFEGNHDLHLAKFWRDDVGARVHPNAATFELNGVKVRVEHGDLINPNDRGYLFLRAFLRSAPLTFLAHHLPDRIVGAIGESASRASRDYTSNAKSKPVEEIRALIRAHARARAGGDTFARPSEPFDLIVTGHVHVADDFTFEIDGREVRSVNLGSWFEAPRALVLDPSGVRFEDIR